MARKVKSPDQEVKVPLRSLSTVALVNRTLTLAAADGHDSMPFFGCVVCGDSRLLTTHSVEGYGDVCASHSDNEPRSKAMPWAAEGRELTRRGVVREEE
jgi:hypothetical protein